MSHIMTSAEFIEKLKYAASKPTVYVLGCFGSPMTDKNKKRYTTNREYNQKAERAAVINACSSDVFGFDCVCLIKGILWGWNADASKTYGGASYQSNGVPDTTITNIIDNYCTDVSEDFTHIVPGEFVVMPEHCGVYIGHNLVIESTPKWADGVQVTELWNKQMTSSVGRKWVKHGKLNWIDYSESRKHRIIQVNIPSDVTSNEINEIKTVLSGMGLEYEVYEVCNET